MSDKTGNLTLLAVLSLFALNSAYPDPLFPFFPFRVCAARHVRIYDQYPVCRDVRATWSVTWFPAAECAIARKNDKRIKNDILEYIDGPTYEKGFSENPTKLKAHTFHENGTEKITELEYDDIGWDDSDEGRAVLNKAVRADAGDEKWINPQAGNTFRMDNEPDFWDPALGLRLLLGLETVVRVRNEDFADDSKEEIWKLLIENADHSPIIIRIGKFIGDAEFAWGQCLTVTTAEETDSGRWVWLWEPFESKETWYSFDNVFVELLEIGHLKDFVSI